MRYQLNISGFHYDQIRSHLYPGDGLEAVAVALCGRLVNDKVHKLVVNEVFLISHLECHRTLDYVSWKTERLTSLLEKAIKYNYAVLKIHSHPGGYEQFSSLDDDSDQKLFSSVFGWFDTDLPHASSIMLPDGRIFGRVFHFDLETKAFAKVSVASDVIKIWDYSDDESLEKEIGKRTAQAFGEGTFSLLKKLRIGVVGCSGTGSPVVEQLVRLGVGELVLVDPDKVELKNLNRILNTKRSDAKQQRYKVDVLTDAITGFDLGTRVEPFSKNIYGDIRCLRKLAECDILFGCVDSIDGRDLMNRISTYYVVPYFDLGIKLEADGIGGISKIVGTVNYIQPGKSSLMSRGLYDSEDLKAAGLYRMYPDQFPDLVKNSYIKNLNVNRPAVISVNMMIGSYAVNEFLNRIHPYKVDYPKEFAQTTIDLTEGCFIHLSEDRLRDDAFLKSKVGHGDRKIFLDLVELSGVENEKLV
ncbi:MAG TPA: ThiF family adenylyltransferase [Cyclobacteriaceae bacterium]|nr:ThiF family adenylyltransferase [Cyclobacteriaceae bacterium]HRJ81004.1 ThiF family adenylyltransferase [Cyclobacteriaceae bacterium]